MRSLPPAVDDQLVRRNPPGSRSRGGKDSPEQDVVPVPVVLPIAELPVRYRAVALLETFVTCGGPHLFRPSLPSRPDTQRTRPLAAGTMTTPPISSGRMTITDWAVRRWSFITGLPIVTRELSRSAKGASTVQRKVRLLLPQEVRLWASARLPTVPEPSLLLWPRAGLVPRLQPSG